MENDIIKLEEVQDSIVQIDGTSVILDVCVSGTSKYPKPNITQNNPNNPLG